MMMNNECSLVSVFSQPMLGTIENSQEGFLSSKLTEYNNSGQCIGRIDSSSWKTHVLRRLTKIALIKQPIVLLHISLLAIVCTFLWWLGFEKKLIVLSMAAGWICVRDVYYKQQSAEAVIIVIIIFNGPPSSSSLHSAFSNVFNPQKYICVWS